MTDLLPLQKRLGQFFSGALVAKLLSALANANQAKSVVDPMCGNGDMLVGVEAVGGMPTELWGIDLDPRAIAMAPSDLSANLIQGDAFLSQTLAKLPTHEWDLVITNPPYVRYQSGVNGSADDLVNVPTSEDVRAALTETFSTFTFADQDDRELFTHLVRSYSGLSDLAVPSWLLAAALVKRGGVLAMVLPEAWLSRDYARPIQYLLARAFRTEVVVEDSSASWFPSALVKTTLLVATRVDTAPSIWDLEPSEYSQMIVGQSAFDGMSLVGGALPHERHPELALRRRIAEANSTESLTVGEIRHYWVNTRDVVVDLDRACARQEWYEALENRSPTRLAIKEQGPRFPPSLASAIPRVSLERFCSLDAFGYEVGQGLRTGGNDFFYVEKTGETVVNDKLGSTWAFVPPAGTTLPVLRRQSELHAGVVVDEARLQGLVLVLEGWALPEDLDEAAAKVPELAKLIDASFSPLPEPMASFVRAASRCSIRTNGKVTRLPQLTAVAPNVREPRAGSGARLPRFWYHLPPLRPRHQPQFAVGRINNVTPRAWVNPGSRVVVDANFSSIWAEQPNLSDPAMLALLNSLWFRAVAEHMGSVMGGGALKLEASHLRGMPFPRLEGETVQTLDTLGKLLMADPDGRSIQAQGDEALLRDAFGEDGSEAYAQLRSALKQRVIERTGRPPESTQEACGCD